MNSLMKNPSTSSASNRISSIALPSTISRGAAGQPAAVLGVEAPPSSVHQHPEPAPLAFVEVLHPRPPGACGHLPQLGVRGVRKAGVSCTVSSAPARRATCCRLRPRPSSTTSYTSSRLTGCRARTSTRRASLGWSAELATYDVGRPPLAAVPRRPSSTPGAARACGCGTGADEGTGPARPAPSASRGGVEVLGEQLVREDDAGGRHARLGARLITRVCWSFGAPHGSSPRPTALPMANWRSPRVMAHGERQSACIPW
jgi:hypothetical protein